MIFILIVVALFIGGVLGKISEYFIEVSLVEKWETTATANDWEPKEGATRQEVIDGYTYSVIERRKIANRKYESNKKASKWVVNFIHFFVLYIFSCIVRKVATNGSA